MSPQDFQGGNPAIMRNEFHEELRDAEKMSVTIQTNE